MSEQKRILVVDDEEQVVFVLKASLRKLGKDYYIDTARNGQEALVKVAETPFDLVITDLNMPGMDGIQLTQAIHATHPGTIVIWITAYGSLAVKKKADELGVERYLPKPLDVAEIRRIAVDVLARVQAEEPPPVAPLPPGGEHEARLKQLRNETEAHCVLLITISGQIVDSVGSTEGLELSSLAALMAGNFLAAHEVARLLGQENTFKLSYHESDQFKVYTYCVGPDYLLTIVFGQETRPGVVWLYARRAAADLLSILSSLQRKHQDRAVLDEEFQARLSKEMDNLLG